MIEVQESSRKFKKVGLMIWKVRSVNRGVMIYKSKKNVNEMRKQWSKVGNRDDVFHSFVFFHGLLVEPLFMCNLSVELEFVLALFFEEVLVEGDFGL